MLENIYNLLSQQNLEDAFNLLINCENEYRENSAYWYLRGDLCVYINEIDLAISCYEKSLSLDILNSIPLYQLINLFKIQGNKELHDFYKEKQNIINTYLNAKYIENILSALNININTNAYNNLSNLLSKSNCNWCFYNGKYFISPSEKILDYYFFDKKNGYLDKYDILVPLNEDYITNVSKLTSRGINSFSAILIYNNNLYITNINKNIIKEFNKGNRDKTVVFHYLNESDANVLSLYKNIPYQFKNKYNRILLKGDNDFNLQNFAEIPLLASVSVSGHEIFINYPCPKLMYNIEVGHGNMSIKSSGALDVMKNFAISNSTYKHADKIITSSNMDMILWASFTSLPKDKFLISGVPRTDLLSIPNSRKNLEKLLNISLNGKKIIFNMPTFHTHDSSRRINGSNQLNNIIKIPEFNYEAFDDFLNKNNIICISKVHHAEAKSILENSKNKRFKNIHIISNKELKKYNLDLYEILGSGNLLITDYSSVYADFLFMEKPIIFTNCDIDEYRKNRGLTLEPYDFWTAGPKVTNQSTLETKILESLDNNNYYKEKRDDLKSIFFRYYDNNSSARIWEHIDSLKN